MAQNDRSGETALLIALRHPLRRRILRVMADGEPTSPNRLSATLRKPLSNVSYHLRVLAHCSAVTLVTTKGIGGAMNQIGGSTTTWAEDETVESAVLRQLLDLHPARLTLDELTREMGGGHGGFAECDAVQRAVRDLAAAGLLHKGEEFVAPTRAAVRFSELLDR